MPSIFHYKHLLNPLTTLIRSGDDPMDAPGGSLRLSDDNKTNLALWNTLGVASWSIPAALLITKLSKDYHNRKVRKSMGKSKKFRSDAIRPIISTTPGDEDDVKALVEAKLEEAINKEMEKRASEDKGVLDDILDFAGNAVKDAVVNPMPIVVPAGLSLVTAYLYNKMAEKRLKQQLLEERADIQKEQRAIDRATLKARGLISDTIDKKASDTDKDKVAEGVRSFLLSPISLAALLTLATGAVGYKYFSDTDENKNKLKVLRDVALGRGVLQDTPQLGLAELPVKAEEILAVPGSTSKKRLSIADPTTGEILDIAKDDPILEEVEDNDKKDAIF